VTGTAGGEMISVVADDHKNIVDVIIKEEVVDPDDVEMI
jgi:DNA-binding protein YbaB